MLAVVRECKLVYDFLVAAVDGEKKVFGKCSQC